MLLDGDTEATADLALCEADRVDFAGGSVTVSFPGPRVPLRLFVRDEGRRIGEIGFDGRRVSFSGEAIGVVRAADGPAAAALRIDLNGRATAAAVEALVENLVLADLSGILTARTALVTVTDRHGRCRTASFALAPVEVAGSLPAPPSRGAPRPATLAAGFPQADMDSDSFVFASPGKP